tara:strand:- start:349 stop:999 length:651 start_codon:yes stop_codon:yes gene_type:complete
MSEKDNLELWRQVEKTDPNYTRKVNSRGGFTAINAQYQTYVATKLWGPMGDTWGIRNLEFGLIRDSDGTPLETYAEGEFFYPGGSIEIASDMFYKPGNDSRKKLRTDMMTKALSQLGFSADVFMGLFDDSKYVDERREEVLWEEDRPRFCSALEKLGYGYEDVALWLESTGRPRPSAMRRSTREMLLDWLSDEDNRFKFHNDVERLLKGEDGDGEA